MRPGRLKKITLLHPGDLPSWRGSAEPASGVPLRANSGQVSCESGAGPRVISPILAAPSGTPLIPIS
jgi:hypothetical protein